MDKHHWIVQNDGSFVWYTDGYTVRVRRPSEEELREGMGNPKGPPKWMFDFESADADAIKGPRSCYRPYMDQAQQTALHWIDIDRKILTIKDLQAKIVQLMAENKNLSALLAQYGVE